MRPDVPKLLEDIRDSCEFILSSASSLTLAEFSKSRTIRQAVEGNFEIIGEALKRIERSDPAVIGEVGDVSRKLRSGISWFMATMLSTTKLYGLLSKTKCRRF